ncbi:hypothetical protein ACP275_08G190200 [Erythranthe tilingii]
MSKLYSQSTAISSSAMFASSLNRSNLLQRLYSRPRNLSAVRRAFSCTIAATAAAAAVPNGNASKYSASRSRNLFSRISPVRRDYDVVLVLDQWVSEGREIHPLEFQRIIRDLRSRKRFSQALQISEWVSRNGSFKLSPSDKAVHLDLVGVVHGLEAAEGYFGNLPKEDKNEKTYGALLSCYVRSSLLSKALVHIQTMKEIGYGGTSLTYNNLMVLYKKVGQLEKIPEILSEMRNYGVAPNNFTYRVCISSFGERSDLIGMEKLLEEVELENGGLSLDWATYSIAAYFFVKGNEKEKALTCMKKLEQKLEKDAIGYNHLISLYAHIGDKNEMMRLWALQKVVCKKQINRDYITILGSLVKIEEFEAAEEVLAEWDSCCHTYDFRVPNVLLIGYCQKGQVEKSELMLRNIVERGKKPIPNSWSIVASGYVDNGNMEKAFECMKEALAVKGDKLKWMPKPGLVTRLLHWIGDKGGIEEVEAFVCSLRTVIPVNRQMYHALIRASVRVGRDASWVLEMMKSDGIVVDDETFNILCNL